MQWSSSVAFGVGYSLLVCGSVASSGCGASMGVLHQRFQPRPHIAVIAPAAPVIGFGLARSEPRPLPPIYASYGEAIAETFKAEWPNPNVVVVSKGGPVPAAVTLAFELDIDATCTPPLAVGSQQGTTSQCTYRNVVNIKDARSGARIKQVIFGLQSESSDAPGANPSFAAVLQAMPPEKFGEPLKQKLISKLKAWIGEVKTAK
jgi:hypothetical protein